MLHSAGWPQTDLLNCPLQELKPIVVRTAVDARTIAQMDQRKTAEDLHTIDRIATNASNKKNISSDMGLLRMIQQGAAWDRNIAAKIGNADSNICEYCGSEDGDIAHVIWHCQKLCTERNNIFQKSWFER